jgi:hypothetical protein
MAAWQSQSGNALIAIQNKLGSNKKILIHSIEINNLTRGASSAERMYLSLAIGTASGGEILPLAKYDTNASLPSGISLRRNASRITTDTSFRRISVTHNATASNPHLFNKVGPRGGIIRQPNGAAYSNHKLNDSGTESIVLRPGEAFVTVPNETLLAAGSQLLLADVVFAVIGSPNRTYAWSGPIWVNSDGDCPLTLINNSASDIVYLKELRLHDTGTLDSPYLRVIPIGSINPDALVDSTRQLPVIKMDTEYPDIISSTAVIVADVPIQPFGLPEANIADSSAATPKGLSYLHTKDFIGPQYFAMFPEYTGVASPGASSDRRLIGLSQKYTKFISEDIVIREGESIGIVSSAELATSTTAVPMSGWSLFEIGIQFSIEPKIIPTITVEVKNTSNTAISSVRVLLTANTGGYMPYRSTVTITNSSTTATVTHSSHGFSTGDKILIKDASHYQNNGVFTITKISDSSYSYTMSSAPGSDPTGTILCTAVILEGTTDVNGKIYITRDINSNQPAIGWVRKSSEVPYYKTSLVSGTISASSDTTLSVLLLSDG